MGNSGGGRLVFVSNVLYFCLFSLIRSLGAAPSRRCIRRST